MGAEGHASPATSRQATRGPGPAAQASPRFSPSHLPVPLPTSSAAALPLFYPRRAQPMPGPQAPGFPPAVPSSLRWPSRAAREFVAALSLTRSPPALAPAAPHLIRGRTPSLHPHAETPPLPPPVPPPPPS